MPAPFITFEGGEGVGKTTHIKLLAARLEASGWNLTLTREPGGSDAAEQLRSLLVEGATGRWSAEAEALLNYAARDSHLREKIRPALASGQLVLCDRFMDSTRAYQGYAGGCDMAMIDAMEKAVVGDTRPDLTLIFDVDPETGLERARGRGDSAEDRFERKGLEFHERLRQGFLEIAKSDPGRCKVIDGSLRIDEIESIIWHEVSKVI
jgi:dTMP kinase